MQQAIKIKNLNTITKIKKVVRYNETTKNSFGHNKHKWVGKNI